MLIVQRRLTRRTFDVVGRLKLIAAAWSFCALCPAELRADEAIQYAKTSEGCRPTPIVAIDNVTAWPNLTVLPDGEIIASVFNQPSHGSQEGEIECWASGDQGQTWKKRGLPSPHKPGSNRMNCAVGLSGGGELIAIVSGWSDKRIKGQTPHSNRPFRAAILDPVICRSSDRGCTWEVSADGLPAR